MRLNGFYVILGAWVIFLFLLSQTDGLMDEYERLDFQKRKFVAEFAVLGCIEKKLCCNIVIWPVALREPGGSCNNRAFSVKRG